VFVITQASFYDPLSLNLNSSQRKTAKIPHINRVTMIPIAGDYFI